MMEAADADNDHVISFEEYAAAYGSLPWVRAQASPLRLTALLSHCHILRSGETVRDTDGKNQCKPRFGTGRECAA